MTWPLYWTIFRLSSSECAVSPSSVLPLLCAGKGRLEANKGHNYIVPVAWLVFLFLSFFVCLFVCEGWVGLGIIQLAVAGITAAVN